MRQEWFNPDNGRHYLIELFEDLLGDSILIRRWTGMRRPGNQKMALMASYEEALHQLKVIEDKRRQRGYRPLVAGDMNSLSAGRLRQTLLINRIDECSKSPASMHLRSRPP